MHLISENGNHVKYNISKEELLQKNIKMPEYQRDLMEEHVMEIVAFEQEYFKKRQHYSFLNCIQFCVLVGVWFCVDGQHRYEALKILNDKPDWSIDIELTYCKDEEEMHEIFRLLNTNTPLPQFLRLKDTRLNIMLGIKKYIKIKYPKYISNSKNARIPNIYLDTWIDIATHFIPEFNNVTEAEEWLEGENAKHYEFLNNDKNEQCKKALEKIGKRTRSNTPFYLGCYWLEKVPNKIDSSLRKKCWNLWYNENFKAENRDMAPCYACNKLITRDNFEAGHIQSHKNGGPNTIENLRPVCGECNKRIGPKDMTRLMF